MGVKGLWALLAPVAEKKSLWELKDQTIAIDLSGWICENQNVDNHNLNLYLRNLFFRTSYLLLLGVKPIFILDGKAPALKFNTIEQRKRMQRTCEISEEGYQYQIKRGDRSRLNSMLKQCEDLLRCLGVPYYYSEGEAEALCAVLNDAGIVDGVITQDSDCFLYGAKTVYKNFNISSNSGSVEMYTLSSIEKKLSLGRNKLIALSLLCGCDYNKGVAGIGKESALKFLTTLSDSHVLKHISSWRENDETSNLTKLEVALRQKAVQNPEFPFLDVQEEFLRNKNVLHVTYQWNQPNMKNFVILTERKLNWPTDYSMEKFLPLLARWHLVNDLNGNILELEFIVKKRKLRNVPSYEIKWNDFDHTTIEPMCLLQMKYRAVIEKFEQSKSKSCKTKKEQLEERKNDMDAELNAITGGLKCISFEESDRIKDDSLTISDFECSVSDLLELSSIVESITGGHN